MSAVGQQVLAACQTFLLIILCSWEQASADCALKQGEVINILSLPAGTWEVPKCVWNVAEDKAEPFWSAGILNETLSLPALPAYESCL